MSTASKKKSTVDRRQATTAKDSRGFGGPVRVVLTAISVFILSQALAVFIVEFFYDLLKNATNSNFTDSIVWQFLFILLAETAAIWAVLKIIKRRGLSPAAIGLGRRPRWGDLKWAAVGFVGFYAVLIALTAIATALFPSINLDQQQDVGFKSLHAPIETILAFIGLVILPPLGEETLVRGYLFSGLRTSLKFLPAMIITSLLFGAAHLQVVNHQFVWIVAVDTFVLSAFLVYLREKTGALYAAMAVHFLNNLIAFIVHFHS